MFHVQYILTEIMKIKYLDFTSANSRHEILYALYSILINLHFLCCMQPLIIGGKYLLLHYQE